MTTNAKKSNISVTIVLVHYMQEDCSVQTGPAQEDALFCHQYYSVTDEPAVITGRLKITFLGLPGWHDVISPICRQLVTGSSALNVNSLDRLKYGWQVKVQSGHLHRYIFEGVLIHRRTRLIRAEKYNHMQSLNCYAHDRRNITNFLWTEPRQNSKFKQTTAHVCLTHEAHTLTLHIHTQ